MERTKSPPFGLAGGKAGAAADVTLTTPDGARAICRARARSLRLGIGDRHDHPRVRGFRRGGQRARAAIRRDLADGYVSEKAAREDYGVADVAALAAESKGD